MLETNERIPVSVVVVVGTLLITFACRMLRCPWNNPVRTKQTELRDSAFTSSQYYFLLSGSLTLVATLCLSSFGPSVKSPLTDYFHEGEILAGYTLISQNTEFPILIHGPGRNLLPGFLATHFAENGCQISFMRLITGIGNVFTLFAVSICGYIAAFAIQHEHERPLGKHANCSLACLLAASLAWTQGTVTNRHILFFCSITLAISMMALRNPRSLRAYLMAIGFGITCAISPIYVYSTGLETLGLAFAMCILLIYRFGKPGALLLTAGIFSSMGGILLVSLFGGSNLYVNAIRDISWWLSTGAGIWSKPLSIGCIRGVLLLICTSGSLLYLAIQNTHLKEFENRKTSTFFYLLSIAILLASRDMWDRSDPAHVGYSMLAVSLGISVLAIHLAPSAYHAFRQKTEKVQLAILLSICLGTFFLSAGPRQTYWKDLSEFKRKGFPDFANINTPDHQILSAEIAEFQRWHQFNVGTQDTMMVLTNEGALNYVIDEDSNLGVLYPIYAATPIGDDQLATALKKLQPDWIVTETKTQWDEIDGIPLKDRLSRTWQVIRNQYGHPTQISSWTVLKRI